MGYNSSGHYTGRDDIWVYTTGFALVLDKYYIQAWMHLLSNMTGSNGKKLHLIAWKYNNKSSLEEEKHLTNAHIIYTQRIKNIFKFIS